MTDFGPELGGVRGAGADNLGSALGKSRNPPGSTPEIEGEAGRALKASSSQIVRFIGGIFRRRTICINQSEPKWYGESVKRCPVPAARRVVDEYPWSCQYCRLKKDKDPPSTLTDV